MYIIIYHFNSSYPSTDGVGLVGEIPKENGKLTSLYSFQIQLNKGVTGTIPKELCGLSDIWTLAVRYTNVSGTIPNCFRDSQMLDLALDFNELSGPIPGELGSLTGLQHLLLNNNRLTGPIPSELGSLLSMINLSVEKNALEGPIPSELGRLQLLDLWLGDNLLTGSLPDELGNLTSLQHFVFDDNPSLMGNPLPVINRLSNLVLLLGSGCDFTGEINDEFLANAPNIIAVDLSHNNFTSPNGFPAHLFSKPILRVLDLSCNQLEGQLPVEIIPFFGGSRLFYLGLYNNRLSGPLPEALTNLTALDHLDLSSNSFDGPIPDFLGDMKDLRFLFLSNNPFKKGSIPDSFANLTNLEELSLRNTSLVGTLPDYIGLLSERLDLVDFGSNALSGPIPDSYGDLGDLNYLLLNDNRGINGSIPETFADLVNLTGLYVDGTALGGGLDFLCGLPNFVDGINSEEGIFADCGGDLPEISCSCSDICTCCDGSLNDSGCSKPLLGNLDASWDNLFRRSNIRDEFVLQKETLDKVQPDGSWN